MTYRLIFLDKEFASSMQSRDRREKVARSATTFSKHGSSNRCNSDGRCAGGDRTKNQRAAASVAALWSDN